MQNFASSDEVGRRVRRLREARSWSQQTLASRAGLAIRTVANVERGQDATLETLRRLAIELGASANDLLSPIKSEREEDESTTVSC
jgi:transcriptional regulator with XRE-family HTH domain